MSKAKPKCPKGCRITDFRGNKMIAFAEGEKPPQFGNAKAQAIVALVDKGKYTPAEAVATAVQFGAYKLKTLDAEMVVEGARYLVSVVAEEKAKAAA